MKIVINGRLCGLNEYTEKCRRNAYEGAKLKKSTQKFIKSQIVGRKVVHGQVFVHFKWYEPNKRRDLDNIAFAKKFIFDALVEKGVIDGDSWATVTGFTDEFYVDKDNPRIEIDIEEINNVRHSADNPGRERKRNK